MSGLPAARIERKYLMRKLKERSSPHDGNDNIEVCGDKIVFQCSCGQMRGGDDGGCRSKRFSGYGTAFRAAASAGASELALG
jgi:hypothetical protein